MKIYIMNNMKCETLKKKKKELFLKNDNNLFNLFDRTFIYFYEFMPGNKIKGNKNTFNR